MKLTKKGMTLFELLAVIVILGIIAAIAFPTVGGLINDTKKDTFASNANTFLQSAVTKAQGEYTANNESGTVVYHYYIGTIPTTYAAGTEVELTDVSVKNPFGATEVRAYATITVTTTDNVTTVTITDFKYAEAANYISKAAFPSTYAFVRKDVQSGDIVTGW